MGNCLVPLTLRSWRVRCGIGPLISSTVLMIRQIPMPHLYPGSFFGSMIRRNFTIYRGVQLDCAIATGLAPLSSWYGWPISAFICGIAVITFAMQRSWRMLLTRLSSSCRAVRSFTSILVLRTQFGRLRTSKSFVTSLVFRGRAATFTCRFSRPYKRTYIIIYCETQQIHEGKAKVNLNFVVSRSLFLQ